MQLPSIRSVLLTAAAIAIPALLLRSAARKREPLPVVPFVDLERYAGRWYEIARLPNRFQRRCESDVLATYTRRDNGKITVVNECRREDGTSQAITGTAWQPEPPQGRLKVRFFWPFAGDYYIIDLHPEYRWALVGEPQRDYLWVLAREPHMEDDTLTHILETAAGHGFQIGKIIRTKHTREAETSGLRPERP